MPNALVCTVAPSPNDQIHVTPVAEELTPKVSGTPVVALADTFRNATGRPGVGTGTGSGAGVGVGAGGVGGWTTTSE